MKTREVFTLFASFLSLFALTAYGQSHEETAEVPHVTRLESASKPIKLIKKINTLSLVATPTCVQDQIYAGYQLTPANEGGDRITTYPASLTTPNVTSNQLSTYTTGVSSWLASSTLGKIKLPAPADEGSGNRSQQCAILNFRKINILCGAEVI